MEQAPPGERRPRRVSLILPGGEFCIEGKLDPDKMVTGLDVDFYHVPLGACVAADERMMEVSRGEIFSSPRPCCAWGWCNLFWSAIRV